MNERKKKRKDKKKRNNKKLFHFGFCQTLITHILLWQCNCYKSLIFSKSLKKFYNLLATIKQLAEIHTNNLQTANEMLIKSFTRDYIFYDMICVVNDWLTSLQMVNTAKIFWSVFTIIKQLFWNFINNTYHIRRRFMIIVNNHSNNFFANGKLLQTSQQPINIISKDIIFVIIHTTC